MQWLRAIILASVIVATNPLADYKDKKKQQNEFDVQQLQQSEAIHFRKIGQVIGDVHFGHLQINIDYALTKSVLTDACKDLRRTHTNGERDFKYMTETKLPKKCYETLNQLSEIEKIFDGLISRTQTSSQGDGHEEHSRQPRQIILATAGAAIIGGLIGWITSKFWGAPTPDPQLTHLVDTVHQQGWLDHTNVIAVAREARNLAKDMETFSYYQDNLYRYLGIFIGLSRLGDETNRFKAGLNDLLHGKLSPALLSPYTLDRALTGLREKLQERSLVLAIEDHHQAYNYPVSYHQHPNLTITVHLHIPALKRHDILDLYKFMPLPLIINSDQGPAYATPLPQHQYLAINHESSQYRVMPAADLANECSHIGDLFICRHSNLVAKKSRPNCLVALFTNKQDDIRNRCHFDFKPKFDELVQLGESTFLLFQTEDDDISFYCDVNSETDPFPAKRGVQQITVPPGCIAESRSFLFEGQITVNTNANDIVPIHYTPVNVSRLTDHTTQDLARIINDLDITEQQSVTKFKQLDEIYNKQVLQMQVGYSLGSVAGLLTLICITVIAYCCYKKHRVVKPIQPSMALGVLPPPVVSVPQQNDGSSAPLYPCVGSCNQKFN
jgi:hypothetical protein